MENLRLDGACSILLNGLQGLWLGADLKLFGGFSGFDPDEWLADYSPSIDNIAADVNSIKKTTNLTEEDLRSMVDMAERRYVNNINLSTQAPVIRYMARTPAILPPTDGRWAM